MNIARYPVTAPCGCIFDAAVNCEVIIENCIEGLSIRQAAEFEYNDERGSKTLGNIQWISYQLHIRRAQDACGRQRRPYDAYIGR